MIVGLRRGLTVLIVALACSSTAAQQRVAAPASVQLALFEKIWTMDRAFSRPRVVTIGIVYQRLNRASFNAKEQILEAGRDSKSIRFVLIDLENANLEASKLTGVQVLYFTPLRSIDLRELLARTRAQGIRTITGVPEYVEIGVAVGITVERDRPRIIINREASRAEGSDFSSQLLKLARVIR